MIGLEGQEDHNLNQQGVLKEKRLFSYAVLFASVLSLSTLAQTVSAQAPSAGAANIAVIDIQTVFKNYAHYKTEMDGIGAQYKNLEQAMVAANGKMKGMVEELRTYKAGSLEFKNLEKQVAEMQSKEKVNLGLQKKDLLESEAKVLYTYYNVVKEEVQNFSLQHNISLVLRYSNTAIDPNVPQSVMQGVNAPVVFQNRIDITFEILQKLNDPSRPAPSPGIARDETPISR